MPDVPLSTPLSKTLVAFTIEFDNEFERRFAETGLGRRFGVSMVMWSNFMRFVEDGITVGDLPVVAGLPRARILSTLGGMERWGYVDVADAASRRPVESKRDGWGSARGLRRDWVVRPTPAGRAAQEIWRALFGEIERRWEERFGADEIRRLREASGAVLDHLDVELPEYLPIVTSANGMTAEVPRRERSPTAGQRSAVSSSHLPTLLSQVLLAYTIDFEEVSEVSLPLSANVRRLLDEDGLEARELSVAAGVSREATSMALTFLGKRGYVTVEADRPDRRAERVRLTSKGRDTLEATRLLHVDLEHAWRERFGEDGVHGLRAALTGVLGQRDGGRQRLSLGLRPHPDGWRATKRYVEQTNALMNDPLGRLPEYPMVLHRGGWPDGS